ncbi:MAG: SDR family NAD(P)-dependent oxidoreductase, partial [Acidimicrobiia bacterium]
MTEFQIDGIAAVTGAGQGIGLGVVGALAERGFDVLALVLEPSHAEAVAERVAGAPGTATVQVLDVTDIGDFAFPGNLQVLVNNAGIRMSTRPVEVIDSREWRRTMDVNFFGMVDMTRLALPIMRANGGGVICNVGSGGQHLPNPFLAAYRASKGAVSAFCESLRVEVAPFGI